MCTNLSLFSFAVAYCCCYSAHVSIVSELPAGMNFDLHWYPKIPGLVSTSSFEGNVGFYNIEVFW
ncbi:hypothetical protein MKW92_019906 [Papaver armeniacum]|nr:hypothetical protein MKW92_019906 [Papaver armeniacum]